MSYSSNTEFDPERPFGDGCTCKGIDYESHCPVCGPLIDRMKTDGSALDDIRELVERMYFEGRITWRQRDLFRWAARKSREAESPARCSRCAQSLDGVEEL
jgi:hypothetical protein